MNSEQKQDYTRRITQANRTGIIVITYEKALDYLREARDASSLDDGGRECRLALKRASRCVEQLLSSLNYDYDISLYLFRLYNYVLEWIRRADYSLDMEHLAWPEKILHSLRESFEKAAQQDTSGPMMGGAEEVYDGLTYNAKGRTNTSIASPNSYGA